MESLKQFWLHTQLVRGLGNNMLTSTAAGVGDLADTLIEIELNGNAWAEDVCVPVETAERGDQRLRGGPTIEVC